MAISYRLSAWEKIEEAACILRSLCVYRKGPAPRKITGYVFWSGGTFRTAYRQHIHSGKALIKTLKKETHIKGFYKQQRVQN